jgi:hypothetical protein
MTQAEIQRMRAAQSRRWRAMEATTRPSARPAPKPSADLRRLALVATALSLGLAVAARLTGVL